MFVKCRTVRKNMKGFYTCKNAHPKGADNWIVFVDMKLAPIGTRILYCFVECGFPCRCQRGNFGDLEGSFYEVCLLHTINKRSFVGFIHLV